MSEKRDRRPWKRSILKYLILASTSYAILMMLHWPIGFTFFTQLSNIFAALAVAWQLICPRSRAAGLAKYAAAVSISATFLVFLFVLAPLDPRGFAAAYAQDHCASLCLHLLTPLLTVTDFLVNDAPHVSLKKRHIALALLPPLAYFLLILALGQGGLRWRGMIAPYPFLNYLAPAGWFGFAPETADYTTLGIGVFYAVLLMLGLFLLLGRLLAAAANRIGSVELSR